MKIFRDTIYVVLGKYGQFVVTIVTVPLCARTLGVQGTGLLAVAASAYFFGSALVDFGLSQMLAGRAARGEETKELRLAYVALRSIVLSFLIVSLGIGIFTDAPDVLLLVLVGLFVGGLSSTGEEWILTGRGLFGRIAAYQMIGRIFYLAALLIILPVIPSPITVMSCLAVSVVISSILSWTQVRGFSRHRLHWVTLVDLLRLGAPSFFARTLTTSYGQGAALIYSSVVSPHNLGLFSAGDKFVRATQSTLDAFAVALLPRIASSLKRHNSMSIWSRAFTGASVAFGLGSFACIALWLSAPLIIGLFYGEGFAEAIPLLRIEALVLPAAAYVSTVTTAVLYVLDDSRGVLYTALAGLSGILVGIFIVVLTGDFRSMLVGVLASEWGAAVFVTFRMLTLRSRDHRRKAPDLPDDVQSGGFAGSVV
nr:lipopolysaccharide biosynthesis protein [Arthrobacter sp. 35W]